LVAVVVVVVVHYLHDAHEMNAYRADHVFCLSVHMNQVKIHWMDLDHISCRHAIEVYPKILLFSF
jgi:hypothetical protein